MSKRKYHGGYNKVHPKWEVKHKCEHCGKTLIANGINWHGDNCVWKGIDIGKVYKALKKNMSVKKVMDTFGTTMYTTTQLKKGFYPNFPKIDVDGRLGDRNDESLNYFDENQRIQTMRDGGHYHTGKELTKRKRSEVYYDSNKVWEMMEMNLDIDEIYRILDKKNKPKVNVKKRF